MNPEQALVTSQLTHMRASLERLHRLAALDDEEFYASPDNAALANHHLQRAIQAVLDIGRHLTIRRRLGRTSSYAEIIYRLYEHHLIDPDLGERLVDLAHMRNRFVHVYWEVSAQEVRQVLRERLEDLEEFIRQIVRFLDKEAPPPDARG
ncbi:MAG TPA: DUF86 domain-containing protein [Armatimonadota bacterium]|nr:DUF86 domain-containing protein [Armatimonadota bacterium]